MAFELSTPTLINAFPAGRAFFLRACVLAETPQPTKTKKVKKKGKKKTKSSNLEKSFELDLTCSLDDFYALLGIKSLEVVATKEDIKQAYRKVSLICHPDKADPENREEVENRFKAVQKAYDHLSNSRKKLIYDSSLEFDDSLPLSDVDYDEESEFYEDYGPVFQRFARFSHSRPVPLLGNTQTMDHQVTKFYKFWSNFRSNRDWTFMFDEAYNLEEAENRFERQWMEKENKKLTADARREEAETIRKLVAMSERRDPRLARIKEREEREFELEEKRREEAREQRAREKAEKEYRLMREEQERREAEKRAERERQEELDRKRQEFANWKLDLRNLCNTPPFLESFQSSDVDKVCLNATKDELSSVLHIEASTDDEKSQMQLARFQELLDVCLERIAANRQQEEQSKRRRKLEKDGGAEWSRDELNALVAAIRRFPSGTGERWERIKKALHSSRSPNEIRRKVKELSKIKGKPGVFGPPSAMTAPAATTTLPSATPKNGKKKKKKKKKNKGSGVEESKDAEQAPDPEDAEDDVWSQVQQKALEDALKEVRTLPKEQRWDRVEELVDGKTKKQCMERFKFIRAQILARKQQQGA